MKLPPYRSLYLARCAVANEFPHNAETLAEGTEEDAAILAVLREKQTALRQLELEIAAAELDLKHKIGFNAGLKLPGGSVLYWKTGGRRAVSRVRWMQLVEDLEIDERTIDRYRDRRAHRRFFLRRRTAGRTDSPARYTDTPLDAAEDAAG